MTIKPLFQGWDVRVGRWVRIQHTAYMQEQVLVSGRGVYTRDDWTRARQADFRNMAATAAEADEQFLQRALGVERRKLDSGLRLADWIERVGARSVLELGCGEMITGWAIKGRLPHLRYVATDFDSFVIERARCTPLLAGLEKSVLDVDEVSAETLAGFDLVAAWDVFYAFSTERLERFLAKIKASGSVFMMCTGQLVGPMRSLSYAVRSRLSDYGGRCRGGQLRDHGFKCSVGYYRDVARRCDLACEIADAPPWHSGTGDCYFFVRFGGRDR